VVLVRKDFGISANNLGGLTTQITWTVALLTLLPTMYCVFMPVLLKDVAEERKRSGLHFLLFFICWVLFLYTFFTRMANTTGKGTTESALTAKEWGLLLDMCFQGGQSISDPENTAMEVFGIFGSIFVSTFTIARFCMDRRKEELPDRPRMASTKHRSYIHGTVYSSTSACGRTHHRNNADLDDATDKRCAAITDDFNRESVSG